MRTDNEILDRIKKVNDDDFLGSQRADFVSYLPFMAAKPFLKPDTTEYTWGDPLPRDNASVIEQIRTYMPFAWDKANNCRGISAMRSLDHMKAWLWMLGVEDPDALLSDHDCYGKEKLAAICEAFGWNWRQWDDGAWRNGEDGPSRPPPESVEPIALPEGVAA